MERSNSRPRYKVSLSVSARMALLLLAKKLILKEDGVQCGHGKRETKIQLNDGVRKPCSDREQTYP